MQQRTLTVNKKNDGTTKQRRPGSRLQQDVAQDDRKKIRDSFDHCLSTQRPNREIKVSLKPQSVYRGAHVHAAHTLHTPAHTGRRGSARRYVAHPLLTLVCYTGTNLQQTKE